MHSGRLEISVEMIYYKKSGKDIPLLSVIDDGHGMTHQDVVIMTSIGHKQPENDEPERIGRFGIGFKVKLGLRTDSSWSLVILIVFLGKLCNNFYLYKLQWFSLNFLDNL